MTALPSSLAGTNISTELTRLQPRVAWDISGEDKSGKTRLLASAPGRVVYNDFDEGAEKTVVEHQTNEAGEQRLWRASYPRPLFAGLGNLALYGMEETVELEFGKQGQSRVDAKIENALHESMQKDHLPIVLKVLNDARKIVESKFFKTYSLDTQGEWDSIIRMAHFGRLAKVPSMLYEQANRDFAALIRIIKGSAGKGHPMNLILASRVREEWEGSGESMKKTGRMKREGNDKVPYLIEEYFRSRVVRTRASDGTIETKFTLELLQSANNPNLVGFVWEDAMIDFKTIASMVKPDVDPAAWEDAL